MKCLPSIHEALGSIPQNCISKHSSTHLKPQHWEVEEGDSVQSHPQLGECQTGLLWAARDNSTITIVLYWTSLSEWERKPNVTMPSSKIVFKNQNVGGSFYIFTKANMRNLMDQTWNDHPPDQQGYLPSQSLTGWTPEITELYLPLLLLSSQLITHLPITLSSQSHIRSYGTEDCKVISFLRAAPYGPNYSRKR